MRSRAKERLCKCGCGKGIGSTQGTNNRGRQYAVDCLTAQERAVVRKRNASSRWKRAMVSGSLYQAVCIERDALKEVVVFLKDEIRELKAKLGERT